MKVFILVFSSLFLFCQNSNAQQSGHTDPPGKGNTEHVDNTRIAGSFDVNRKNIERGVTEHINVNYALSSLPFTNSVNLELYMADPMLFSAEIVDSKGQRRIHWQASKIYYYYNEPIDISRLTPGDYKLDLYTSLSPDKVYSISFTKVATR